MLEIPTIKRLSEKYQKTPAQICLKWSLQNGYCIIPKSNHEERLKTNIELFDWEISKNDMREINQLNEHKKVLPDPNQIFNSFLNLGKPQNK
jgi:diketogulonate reductase-like aldo/keto reductase